MAELEREVRELSQANAAYPTDPPRLHPNPACWPDTAELWFSVLTRGLPRRRALTSPTDPAEKSTNFAIRHNPTAKP